MARGAADPLPKARQLCRHGADLCSQLLKLLLLSQDQGSDGGGASPASPLLKSQPAGRPSPSVS
jgi:hypothetical protein